MANGKKAKKGGKAEKEKRNKRRKEKKEEKGKKEMGLVDKIDTKHFTKVTCMGEGAPLFLWALGPAAWESSPGFIGLSTRNASGRAARVSGKVWKQL